MKQVETSIDTDIFKLKLMISFYLNTSKLHRKMFHGVVRRGGCENQR